MLYTDEEFVFKDIPYDMNIEFEDINSNSKRLKIIGTSNNNESIEIKGTYKCNKILGYVIELKLDESFNGYDKLTFVGREIGF